APVGGAAAAAPLPAAPLPAPPAIRLVAAGPPRAYGEAVGAASASGAAGSAVAAVAATDFAQAGPTVRVWARRPPAQQWAPDRVLLPAGFQSSYDPDATALPDGSVLVSSGTALADPSGCLVGGSVAVMHVTATGATATGATATSRGNWTALVDDQRATAGFDDRPAIAAGTDGLVWAAWSHGPAAERCEVVGHHDVIELAVSRDGGRRFSRPMTLPSLGAGAAFGVRLATLDAGRVAVAWTELSPTGSYAVALTVADASGGYGRVRVLARGTAVPRVLPGASFFTFEVAGLARLGSGRLAVSWPDWRAGRADVVVAVGSPGGPWRSTTVAPPSGADLLLPAVAAAGGTELRLVCAVHRRAGDALGYASALLDVTTAGQPRVRTPIRLFTPLAPGPGFFEIGELLVLAAGDTGGLTTALVVAGATGSTVQTATWPAPAVPPAAAPALAPSSSSRSPSPLPLPTTARADARRSGSAASLLSVALITAALVGVALAAAALLGAARVRRRRRRAGALADRRG
ncbi:MAG TPA: hypothetical protein VNE21_08685, partial [Mycobacteriales bacterium]|nr:hypothetical protein [Mycobacteriales bacterium]